MTPYEELKNIFSTKKFIKNELKKYFILIGIVATVLFALALVYSKGNLEDFSIKYFGILFVIISIVVAIVFILEKNCVNFFKANIPNVNNFLIDKYDYKINDDLMTKQIGKFFYSLEYNIGEKVKNIVVDEKYRRIINSGKFYICLICKIYNMNYIEYSELSILMKQGTNKVNIMPKENSIKFISEISNTNNPEEVLWTICQDLDFFELNLKKVLEKDALAKDTDFGKNTFDILNKYKKEKYISLQSVSKTSEINYNYDTIDLKKSAFNNETLHSEGIAFKNYASELYKKIFKNVLIVDVIIKLIYYTFYILTGNEWSTALGELMLLIFIIPISLPLLLEDLLFPSYVLTKKFGLREEKNERFYGTLSNGIRFCVRPYKSKRFFENKSLPFFFRSGFCVKRPQTKLRIAIEIEHIDTYLSAKEILSISQNANVEQNGNSFILYEEIENADIFKEEMLDKSMKEMLNKLVREAEAYGKDIIIEKDYEYNIKWSNIINRCLDKATFTRRVILNALALYVYANMLYHFIIDVIEIL